MSKVTEASQLFRDGCACSQAILAVYGQPLGLPRKTAMQVAAGFAGGMRLGDTCGAVTGALMVLGLRHAAENRGRFTCRVAQVDGKVVGFLASSGGRIEELFVHPKQHRHGIAGPARAILFPNHRPGRWHCRGF